MLKYMPTFIFIEMVFDVVLSATSGVRMIVRSNGFYATFYKCSPWSLYKRLEQAFSSLVLEIHFPADFSANPNQTHLNKLIKVLSITRTTRGS